MTQQEQTDKSRTLINEVIAKKDASTIGSANKVMETKQHKDAVILMTGSNNLKQDSVNVCQQRFENLSSTCAKYNSHVYIYVCSILTRECIHPNKVHQINSFLKSYCMGNKQFSFIDNSSVEYDLRDGIHSSKTSCINMAMKIRDSVRQKP